MSWWLIVWDTYYNDTEEGARRERQEGGKGLFWIGHLSLLILAFDLAGVWT